MEERWFLLVDDDAGDIELTLHALQKIAISNEVRLTRDGVTVLQ